MTCSKPVKTPTTSFSAQHNLGRLTCTTKATVKPSSMLSAALAAAKALSLELGIQAAREPTPPPSALVACGESLTPAIVTHVGEQAL